MCAERIPGTNMVHLLDGEFIIAMNGERIEGPQVVRVYEFSELESILVEGDIRIDPTKIEARKWAVSASSVDDFVQRVQKET